MSKATVMAVVNQKGGTGKTTTCENLGIGLAREGKGAETVREAPEAPAAAGQTEGEKSTEGIDPELLAKVLANPEMAALLTTLARNLK